MRPFTCGKTCLQEFKCLMNRSAAHGKALFPPTPMKSIPEGMDMDLAGDEGEDCHKFEFRKVAFDLAKLYPDERESLITVVWLGHKTCHPLDR